MTSIDQNAAFTKPAEYHTFAAILFDMGELKAQATAESNSLISVRTVHLLIAPTQS